MFGWATPSYHSAGGWADVLTRLCPVRVDASSQLHRTLTSACLQKCSMVCLSTVVEMFNHGCSKWNSELLDLGAIGNLRRVSGWPALDGHS